MSDVEKAISGLVEDEELLQAHQQQQKKQLHYQQQQQQQQQEQQLQHQQQQQTTIAVNKININSYNLQNETGNSSLLQKQSCYYKEPVQQAHQQQETNLNTTTYLTAKRQNCLSRLAKLLYSTPGLVIMVVAYTIMGAFIFPLLEAPQDITKSALIAKSREECLKELWIITEKLNVLYERNWTILVHEQLRRFEGTIVAATRNMATGATSSPGAAAGGGDGILEDFSMATEATAPSLGRFGNSNSMEYSDLTATKWTFGEALLYSVTVITTIGHGSLTPRTAGGKIATILYALIGVPLMLMCLSSLGGLLAEALQCTYARICCHLPQYAVEDGDDFDQVVDHGNRSHRQYFKRQSKQPRKVEINVEKATTHQCDYQQHPNDENCKNCKYDAIIGETKGMHGYDYKQCNDAATTATPLLPSSPPSSGTSATAIATATATASANTTAIASASAMPAMNLGHKEDCCQLLQNSSGKVTKHLSSCMQLKMSPTMSGSVLNATTATTAQQQQQQYYQQRPDVMLMTNGHKVSAQQPTTMNTNCRMLLPPTLPNSQTQRFYANTAPAIATYHLVSSASANSSPTHQQSIRHYILPQMPPPSPLPSTSLTSTTGTQHFMAVPSAMIRFHHQTSPQASVQQQQQYSVNTTSNLNINPLSLPAPAAATVYFPIVTPAAVAADSSSSDSKNTTQQSLVKYHTIQMPHKRQRGLSLYQQTDLHDNQVVTAVEDIDSTLFPPPPPPAYHTATVHGIRRAKFLAKPLPQEINTLLHESDISSRHDLSQNFKTFNNSSLAEHQQQQQQHVVTTVVYTPGTHSVRLSNENSTNVTEGPTAVTTAVNSFYGSSNASPTTASSSPVSTATLTNNTNSNNTTNIYENHDSAIMHSLHSQQTPAVNLPVGLMLSGANTICEESTTATVDIMEDEEEQEQQRLGNCNHGTPSRVPLLTSSSNFVEDKAQKRSFLNATAASFHRHTSNTFQRSSNSMANQAKSVIINRKGECNLHIPKRRNSSSATICYGDQYDDTSEDECGALKGANIYELKHLHPCQTARNQTDKHLAAHDFYDNYSLVSLSDSASQVPQVPIILVVFILTFYVCMGTVIFALWENWSLIDGAYFCFVTLTTIGYGDFVPWRTFQGPEIQLFACCAYLLLGLVLVAMSFNILETQLIWKCKRLAVRLKLAKE